MKYLSEQDITTDGPHGVGGKFVEQHPGHPAWHCPDPLQLMSGQDGKCDPAPPVMFLEMM